MKAVIMIAHAFPPEGTAGVYRPLRFARHLPTLGWNPTVVSAKKDHYDRYDSGLLALIPEHTEVVSVRSRDPWTLIQSRRARRLQKGSDISGDEISGHVFPRPQARVRSFLREIVRRAEAWAYHPDMAMGWIGPAVDATVKIAIRKRADVIWATAGPVSSFVVARRASQRTGVPYVLDFRDAWTITYNEFEARRPAWAARADRRTLYRLLKGAQAVTFRYHTEAECYWNAYAGALDESRIHIIPNGYEGPIDESVIPGGEKCTILYAGTLSSYRYETLLQALRILKTFDGARAARLRLVIVGEGAGALAREAAALGLSDLVETPGPTSQEEVIRLQRDAHVLLVLGRPPSMKGHELFAGAKLFSYLKAGRPILGVLPPDETKKILYRLGVSTVADSDSPSEIVDVLRQLLDAWAGHRLTSLVPDRRACELYSAGRQTAALVRALEGRLAEDRFVPNAAEIPQSLRNAISGLAHGESGRKTDVKPKGNVFLHS
jgi:glycosyltransferase involved in cell wall biosynthesis